MTTFQKQFLFVAILLVFLIVLVSQGFSKPKSKEFTRDTSFTTTNIVVIFNDGDTAKILTKIPRNISIISNKIIINTNINGKIHIEDISGSKVICTKSKIKVIYTNSVGNIITYIGTKPRNK